MLKLLTLVGLLLVSGPSDEMFDALKSAETEQDAARAEADIVASWTDSGSGTVDLLMQRAGLAEQAGDMETARALYDRVVIIEPTFSEGWYRRAALFLRQENYPEALRDINETLIQEPRHFPAWTGLGHVLETLGSTEEALEAYEKALDIHPHLVPAKRAVTRLKRDTSGTAL
ncbi:MAG: tetratricopeptide repeat protein [Pseudomonadota bacterium]